MPDIQHRTVRTNGIDMHIAEMGEGPLVLLCHGFPECWYSWRHQLPALAAAGYRAVAPDQRGYGGTDAPEDVDDYTQFHLGRRHGGPGGRARRRAGGDRRPRLGRPGCLKRRHVAAGCVPRRRGALRARPVPRRPPPVQARWLCGRGIRMARAAGGAMRACERLGFEVAPVLIADAQPSSTIRSETY